jgi:3-deoxy-7-phosphoheptulonate synthase
LRTGLACAARGESLLVQVGAAGEGTLHGYVTALRAVGAAFAYTTGRPVLAVCDCDPPDGDGLVDAYTRCASRVNVLRTLVAEPSDDPDWPDPTGPPPQFLAGLYRARRFAAAFGTGPLVAVRALYTSQRSALGGYGRGLLRLVTTGPRARLYAGSAHLLRPAPGTDHRARAAAGLAGLVANPVGLDVGPAAEPARVADQADRLDRYRAAGLLVLTCGLGAGRVRTRLPAIVDAVTTRGHVPVWQCDPTSANRCPDAAVDEYAGFLDVMRRAGQPQGGVLLHLTRAGLRIAARLAAVHLDDPCWLPHPG